MSAVPQLDTLKPPPSFGQKTVKVPTQGGDLVTILRSAGFKGQGLKTAWAIAKRESSGNPHAYNPDTSTGDQSYGLFQINMLGGLGPSRRQAYGLKSNEDLFDPATNARVAYAMSKGGTDFGAWGIGPNAYRKMPALDFSGFPGGGGTPDQLQAAPSSGVRAPAFKLPEGLGADFGSTLLESEPQALALKLTPPPGFGAPADSGRAGLPPPGEPPGSAPISLTVPPPPVGKTKLAPVGMVVEGNNLGARAVEMAATQLGKPYVFGSGPDTSSFDCSDLVQWSYKQLGINIPRDTWGQQKALPLKSWAELRPGDPIYRRSGGHVVIYAGNGKVIAAPHTGTVVQYQSLANFPPDQWEVRSIT